MLSSVREQLRILLEVCNFYFNITKIFIKYSCKKYVFNFEVWPMFLSVNVFSALE